MNELISNIIYVLQKYFVWNKAGMEHFNAEIVKLISAFGGCDKCWGRGYVDPDYTYCDCERGQQLENIKNLLKK